MPLRLIIEDVDGAQTVVPLDQSELTIGRRDGNTIQLTEQNVSRDHARLSFEQDSWVVEDLSSYNGVLLNGAPIQGRTHLSPGDQIIIGDYVLVLADPAVGGAGGTGGGAAGGTAAANEEVVLASSSTDLPALSAEELDAIRSGRQLGGPAPVAAVLDEDFDEPATGGGAGKIVGAILVLGLLGAGGYFATQGGGSAPAPKAANSAPAAAAGVDDQDPAGAAVAADASPDAAPAQGVAENEEDPDVIAAAEGGEGGAIVTQDGGEDDEEYVEVELPGDSPRQRSKPKGNPDDMLKRARKAQLDGKFKRAYSLARDSYRIKRSQGALQVMGVAACNMKAKAKAKSAYDKLSGGSKSAMKNVCAKSGIKL